MKEDTVNSSTQSRPPGFYGQKFESPSVAHVANDQVAPCMGDADHPHPDSTKVMTDGDRVSPLEPTSEKEKSEKTNRKSKQHSYKRKSDLKYYLTHFILSKIEDVDFATVSSFISALRKVSYLDMLAPVQFFSFLCVSIKRKELFVLLRL